jgi:hypothetical protein
MSDEMKKTQSGEEHVAGAAAWDDPDAPPTPEEIAASERLRDALEAPSFRFTPSDQADASEGAVEAELARALRVAVDPRPLTAADHRAILDRTLGAGARRVGAQRRATVAVLFGGLAAAAAVLLAVTAIRLAPQGDRSAARPLAAPATLAVPRSTEALFDAPFPKEERTSARVDRIARARARDLRDNRYARWGVP